MTAAALSVRAKPPFAIETVNVSVAICNSPRRFMVSLICPRPLASGSIRTGHVATAIVKTREL
jgi:hypothetical protein